MKNILFILSMVVLSLAVACSDDGGADKTYNSVISTDFNYSVTEIIAGVTPVTFTNATTVEGTTIDSYFWHFGFAGEGNWSEEAEPDPVIYTKPGEYTVTLTAWGADGNRKTVTKKITVLASNMVPVAEFRYSPTMISAGTTVSFTDESTDSDGQIVSREWLFPDNTTSTAANPTYTFNSVGMYRVQLTVTDNRGDKSTSTKTVNVRGNITGFTQLWSTAVASGNALCPASVVSVSSMGNLYFASGDGKLVALNANGQKAWEYDAAANDKVYLQSEIAYPSVDADGTVYWAAHGYNGAASTSQVYAFNGETGHVIWKNSSAYAYNARIAYSTPCITPSSVVIGNRGANGAIRGFDKSTGKNSATVAPANGGINAAVVGLKNGSLVFTLSGNYGFGYMISDDTFTWSAVPTANAFTPSNILTSNRCQPCVDASGCLYLPGVIYGTGSWNLACFDASSPSATTVKTPKWAVKMPNGFSVTGASLSADASTLYIVEDKALPAVVYALDTSNGATRWSYTLDAGSNSVPAVDNLGQIHLCTLNGDYVVLSSTGSLVYKEHLADAIDGSPSISDWGYAYVVGKVTAENALKMFAIALPNVSAPAASAWSQYGQNARHINYQK